MTQILTSFMELCASYYDYPGSLPREFSLIGLAFVACFFASIVMGIINVIKKAGRGPIATAIAYLYPIVLGLPIILIFFEDFVGYSSFNEFSTAFYLACGVAGFTGIANAVATARNPFHLAELLRYLIMPFAEILLTFLVIIVIGLVGGAMPAHSALIMFIVFGLLFGGAGEIIIVIFI